jgi:hypothetical protein
MLAKWRTNAVSDVTVDGGSVWDGGGRSGGGLKVDKQSSPCTIP